MPQLFPEEKRKKEIVDYTRSPEDFDAFICKLSHGEITSLTSSAKKIPHGRKRIERRSGRTLTIRSAETKFKSQSDSFVYAVQTKNNLTGKKQISLLNHKQYIVYKTIQRPIKKPKPIRPKGDSDQ